MYWLNFSFLLIEHIRCCMKSKKNDDMFLGTAGSKEELIFKANSKSPWHMWKFCSHWSQMTFLFEIVITIGFWSFVYDAPNEPTLARTVCLYMDHSVPFVLLCIDFFVNRIYYELHSMWINLVFLLVYGGVNFGYTEITGSAVYPVITWDSAVAVLIAFSVVPVFMLLWLGLFYLSAYKFRK